MTFRPDKCEIAYEFRNSISTYIRHLLPDADLTNVSTYEAIVNAQDEIYDPQTQQFTTKNDEEIEQQFYELLDDDFNDWLDIPDGKTSNIKITTKPKFIVGEKKYLIFLATMTLCLPWHKIMVQFLIFQIHLMFHLMMLLMNITTPTETQFQFRYQSLLQNLLLLTERMLRKHRL